MVLPVQAVFSGTVVEHLQEIPTNYEEDSSEIYENEEDSSEIYENEENFASSSDDDLHSGIVHWRVFTMEDDSVPEPNEPPPLFPQVKLTISSRIKLSDHLSYPLQTSRFDFDPDMFKDDKELVSLFLSYILESTGLFDDYSDLDSIVDDIMRKGLEFSESLTSDVDKEPQVLQLVAEIEEIVEQHIDYENYKRDSTLERAAVEESELELEACNYGMVPAEEESVKKMLKKVVKAESGDCMICLEDLRLKYRMLWRCRVLMFFMVAAFKLG
ncbi:hypothetical protein COLO4_16607 [Corchorus olitorius]|uniref:Zinc finger, RING/FYVE/PHD-type n=1 Tax=Corchorus olitorius TaxID=93759 RepID=A0A1R3JGK1_9ROSI|nr:hypothetical protein COLO4_16607 [Corchorus olitorius]